MRQILDVKPDHESVVVERIETYLVKSLKTNFPDRNFDAFSKKFSFTTEEKTLITDSTDNFEDKPSLPPAIGFSSSASSFSTDLEKTTTTKFGSEKGYSGKKRSTLIYLLIGLILLGLGFLVYLLFI